MREKQMITFSNLGAFGRLGNQLFQYAILLSVGAENDYEVKIPKLDDKEWHGQKCLLKNFNIKAKTLDCNDVIKYFYNELERSKGLYDPTVGLYDPTVFNVPDNSDLFGYFGDYRYLKKHEDLIINEMSLKENILEKNRKRFFEIKQKYADCLIISLHIRRGDTALDMYSKKETLEILDINSPWQIYFSNARKMFDNKKCKFLVFTGGSHSNNNELDYIWCKRNLKGDEFIYCDDNIDNPIDDFAMMYLCDAHILSASSTLSWWVGFLDKKNDKITIAPEKYWFLTKAMHEGFYPDNFILV
jgi:hypothetical protein